MKKITWNALRIEITRRCQLECEHCMRGPAQNIDISYSAIDNLLENTDSIGHLSILGGEPLINLDAVSYILRQISERKIPLAKLDITTNGIEKSERFVNLIKAYHKHIEYCQSFMHPEIPAFKFVTVGISTDKYHPSESIDAYNYYYDLLDGKYATVKENKTGDIPQCMGRAKEMKDSILMLDQDIMNEAMIYPFKVAMVEKDNVSASRCTKNLKIEYEDQVIVMCPIYLTAKGALQMHSIFSEEYKVKDKCCNICYVNDNVCIYEKLKEYNDCIERYFCDFMELDLIDSNIKENLMAWIERYSQLNNLQITETVVKIFKSRG